jgi:hypothetical protein
MAAIPRTNAAKTEKRMNRSSNQDVEQDVQAPGRILSHGRLEGEKGMGPINR